ncbi:MAG: hypothetical protein CVU48_05405 [Candidatus Cloacimonetes bacterium HGW-Cloacimonetes-1]|jgi:outer membrane protein assembly factor BamA|nr:MAG: hypothetical protein CVU48_05405 [Candidatus Cloacimonetes bacterium HGW-Cloacimonetes-1]
MRLRFAIAILLTAVAVWANAVTAKLNRIEILSEINTDSEALVLASGLKPGIDFESGRVTEAIALMQARLQSEGHYFIRIPYPDLLPQEDGSIVVVFHISEVMEARIKSVDFVGNRYLSTAKLRQLLVLSPEPDLAISALPKLQQQILNIYLNRSYLFARVELDSLLQDEGLRAVIRITEGKPLAIRNYIVQGNKTTKESTILNLSGINRARYITPNVLQQAEQNILRKTYIKTCNIVPVDDQNLLIRITEGNMTYLEGVVGLTEQQSGKRDFSGMLRLRFLNLWGTDRSLKLYWRQLPTQSGELEFSYHESGSVHYPVAGDISLYRATQDSTWIKSSTTAEIYYYLLYQRYGVELALEQIRPGSRRPIIISRMDNKILGVFWSYQRSDHSSNPSRGWDADARYRFIFSDDAVGKPQKTAIETNLQAYVPLSLSLVGAVGFHLRNLNDSGAEVYEQYSMGGYNSLRGYREDEIRSWRLGWMSYELRYRMSPESRTYIFCDNGFFANAKNNTKYDLFGVGLGIKVKTKLGILGIEYGLGYRDRRFMDVGSGMIHAGIDSSF